MDVVVNTRIPELEFSWEGIDDIRPVSGRGKIEFSTPIEGEGILYIHNGDSSTFSIKRMEEIVPDNVVKFRYVLWQVCALNGRKASTKMQYFFDVYLGL